MIDYMLKRLGLRRLHEASPRPRITPVEYEQFFDSPVWLVMRSEVAQEMDDAFNILCNPAKSEQELRIAQTYLQALQWFLGLENTLRERVTNHAELIAKSQEQEERLRQVMDLLAPELDEQEETDDV